MTSTVFHCNACLYQGGLPEDMLTLAGYLGSVDLWYDCNITGLGAMILKLAQMVINIVFWFQFLLSIPVS